MGADEVLDDVGEKNLNSDVLWTVDVMIRDAFASESRSPLDFTQGNMTTLRYLQKTVVPYVFPYFNRFWNQIFQDIELNLMLSESVKVF